jgi:hypothetical protein
MAADGGGRGGSGKTARKALCWATRELGGSLGSSEAIGAVGRRRARAGA